MIAIGRGLAGQPYIEGMGGKLGVGKEGRGKDD